MIGKLGKKARIRAYENMAGFLYPNNTLESCYTIFAMSSSYAEEVIDKKREFENLELSQPDRQEPAKTVLNRILSAPQLQPLTADEIAQIINRIREFHGRAYDWNPDIDSAKLRDKVMGSGFLLRTRLRSAIEILDQLYQYGEAGDLKVGQLFEENLNDESVPDLGFLTEE